MLLRGCDIVMVIMGGIDMVDGEAVSRDINSVKTSGIWQYNPLPPTITVNSQPDILGNPHETKFQLSKPDDCEAFLKTLNGHTKLQEAMKAGGQESAVARAIDNLAASFSRLDEGERNKKAQLIGYVGNKFPGSDAIAKAVASANEAAGRKPNEALALKSVERRYEAAVGEKLAR
jgi:hypothetical protein